MSIIALGGRSHKDGIDFIFHMIPDNKELVQCTRREDGGITAKLNGTRRRMHKFNIKRQMAVVGMAIIIAIFTTYAKEFAPAIRYFGLIGMLWAIILCWYFVNSKLKSKKQLHRYHAAEHRVLNYFDDHYKLPYEISDLKGIGNISVRCGSTLLALVLIIFSEIFISVTLLESIVLKIVCIIFSVNSTFVLWSHGYCDFLQKLTLEEPTTNELELAVEAMRAYQRFQNEK